MFYIVLHHIFVMSVIPVFKGQLAHHWLSIIYCRLHFKCVWTIHMSHNEGMIYHPYYLWLEIIGINPIFPNTLARYNTMHQYMIRCKNGMNFGCTHFLHTSFNIFFLSLASIWWDWERPAFFPCHDYFQSLNSLNAHQSQPSQK